MRIESQERELAARVGETLIEWYGRERRDLPWRKTRDPFRIWVSETMLQQTRVETVIPYYERFLRRFPSIEHLARAREEDVLKEWEGLGYYSRARNLFRGAQVVMERFGGRVPDDPDVIREIPGVGPYTAGAILSIAYDRDIPAVDGNALRVFSRIFLVDDPVDKQGGRRRVAALMEAAIPAGCGGAFNQAVMDLGAGMCLPRTPKCPTCPLKGLCRANAEGVVAEYPLKGKKKPPRPMEIAAGFVTRGGRWLVRRRPERGLLAGLWELPCVERGSGESWEEAASRALAEMGMTVHVDGEIARVDHVFSHLKWHLRVYRCTPRISGSAGTDGEKTVATGGRAGALHRSREPGGEESGSPVAWIGPEDLSGLAFPAVYRKIWPLLEASGARGSPISRVDL
ncbi:MAG: A/G-specific adenine glycosylase [Kyrpidia sp.]|nr:A/G-specific adenine glycosylase [Kyrpidia sp.]